MSLRASKQVNMAWALSSLICCPPGNLVLQHTGNPQVPLSLVRLCIIRRVSPLSLVQIL
jgi:hypothetical protein